MYCCHCGKYINEHKLEQKSSSLTINDENGELQEVNSDAPIGVI